MNRTIQVAALFALLLATLAPARAGADKDLRTALAPGDGPDVPEKLLRAIEGSPESPAVPIALAGLRAAQARGTDISTATGPLLALLGKGVRNGANDAALRGFLWSRLRQEGRFEEADALAPTRGCLLHWLVCGPFGFEAESLLDHPYGPESSLSLTEGYPDGIETRRFRAMPAPRQSRDVDPLEFLRPAAGVTYSVAQVESPEARGAWLVVTSTGSLRVWHENLEVLRVDRLRERTARTQLARIRLDKGWNRILVKTAGRNHGFSVCIADDDLRPLEGLEEEEGSVLHEVPVVVGKSIAEERHPWSELVGDAPWTRAARAVFLDAEGMDPEALAELEKAVEELPDVPDLRYRLGLMYERASHLPEVHRKNLAKEAYRKALELDPAFVSAEVRLAALLHADDRSEDAARDLRAILEKHPDRVDARMQLAAIARDRGWEKEAVEAARLCLETCPYPPALSFLVEYADRYRNRPEAAALTEKLLGTNRASHGTLTRLADYALDRGDVPAALSLRRRIRELFPDHTGPAFRLADLLADAGKTDEAVALLRDLAARRPRDPRYPKKLAEVLRLAGDREGALAAYASCLERDPGQGALRREIDRMKGEPEDFAAPWEPDVAALIKDAPGREEYPRAPAVVLLDHMVTRVWPDGSSSDIVHMVTKVMDEKGVEAYGRVNTSGETLAIRTIDPEGRVFEPIGVRENSFNMPALAPGAIVEYRSRLEIQRDRRWFDSGEFWFADPEFDNAVLLSRWVVILPKGFRTDLLLRNFDGTHEVREEGDTVVHVFERRNSARTEREPFMPEGREFLPYVRLLRNRPLSDPGYVQADRQWRNLAPTPRIREEAERVAGDVEGDVGKARALYAHVNELITGGFSFGGPTATLIEKAGDRFDLLASLLLAAGVDFEIGVACPDRGEEVEWEVVEPDVFRERCLRIAGPDGDPTWIFTGSRYFPFGRIPDRYRSSPVLVLDGGRSRIETLPPGRDDLHENVTRASIRLFPEREKTELSIEFRYGGDGGYALKDHLKDIDVDERRQQVERWLSSLHTGAVLRDFELPELEVLGPPAVFKATATLPNFLQPEGDGVEAELGFGTLDLAATYVGKPERIHDMVLRGTSSVRDEVTIDLGGAYRVRSLPEGHCVLGPIGSYSLSVRKEGGKIRVAREVRLHPGRITPDEYREFVHWVKDIDEAESRKILLAPLR